MHTIEENSDITVDNVSILEWSIVWNSVTNNFID